MFREYKDDNGNYKIAVVEAKSGKVINLALAGRNYRLLLKSDEMRGRNYTDFSTLAGSFGVVREVKNNGREDIIVVSSIDNAISVIEAVDNYSVYLSFFAENFVDVIPYIEKRNMGKGRVLLLYQDGEAVSAAESMANEPIYIECWDEVGITNGIETETFSI